MISATTPTATLTTTPRFAAIADSRWQHWHAATLVWLAQWERSPIMRKIFPKMPLIETLRSDHRLWLSSLLSRGIPLRVIRRLALDDPRESRASLESRVALYLSNSERLRAARPLRVRKESQ
jgi:hypothetical protein